MKKANFYKKSSEKRVKCHLCNHKCVISPNGVGYCRVRKNLDGTLYSLVYNKTLTLTADPIEKKPLYNFMPGTHCNGIATYGCNFKCDFCQNYHLSQEFTEKKIKQVPETTPKQIIEDTLNKGLDGIAYTYVEPTIFAEYALDTMKLAKKKELYNVWVSNGYMTKKAAEKISKNLDAINIDLKGNNKFYKEKCGGVRVKPVKKSIKFFHRKGVHVEVTNLIVPGYNDSKKDFEEIAEFVASVDKKMPLHFSRFYPHYKMKNTPPTPQEKITKAVKTAREKGLKFVYLGNIPGEQDTFCPNCGEKIIERNGYSTVLVGLSEKGKCSFCGAETGIIMLEKIEK